ncbi:MAG: hypothetical protein WC782_13180 [Methylococcaceae bacterium]|jgi:hypothetical protein
MSERLDDIFTPDKLRKNWQLPTPIASEPTQLAVNVAIHSKYQELLQLIAQTYPDTSRLSGRFTELTEQIEQSFPKDAAAEQVDGKQKMAVVDLLEQLEELLWALGLPARLSK